MKNKEERPLAILARLADGGKAWHVYARFVDADKRNTELEKLKGLRKLSYLQFKTATLKA